MTEDVVWGGGETGGSVVDTQENMCGEGRKEDGGGCAAQVLLCGKVARALAR